MQRAIKYRIYPNSSQKELIIKTFGCCRKLYNLLLQEKLDGYAETGMFPEVHYSKYKKMPEHSYFNEIDSDAFSNVERNLQAAFTARFSKKRKKKNGFPKFKKKKTARFSYKTNNTNNKLRIEGNYLKLSKIGWVRIKIHKHPDLNWKLKSACISMEKDGTFYASILFEFADKSKQVSEVDPTRVIGLDYKSDGLYVDSNGASCQMPHFYRKSQRRRKLLQRKLSKKIQSHVTGYNGNKPVYDKYLSDCINVQKARKRLAKLEHHVKNQRQDFLHKESAKIANLYDFVIVEDINMKQIANKKFSNGKATNDNGFGVFREFLAYKLSDRGGALVKVDKWFPSSQLCSCCRYKNSEARNLNIRKWTCPECGTVHDRDINAAINIRNEGLRLLAEL